MATTNLDAMFNHITNNIEDMKWHVERIRQLVSTLIPTNSNPKVQTPCSEIFPKEVAAQTCEGLSHQGKDEHTHEHQCKIAISYTLVHVDDECVTNKPLSVSSSLPTYEYIDSLPLVDNVNVVVNRMLNISLELDNDSLESKSSKSVRGLDHSLFRYNVLFEDSLNTPNRPSSENDGIACLESYSIYANPLWCDNIPPKDGNHFLEDESNLKGKECVVLETTSSSTLCGFSEDTIVEVELSPTFLYSLFTCDDMYANVESRPCSFGKDYGKWVRCLDPCLWPLFPFDPSAILEWGRYTLGLEAETDDPEKELKPGVDILGAVDEMFYETYEKFVHSCVNNKFYWVQVLSLSSDSDLLSTFIFISAVDNIVHVPSQSLQLSGEQHRFGDHSRNDQNVEKGECSEGVFVKKNEPKLVASRFSPTTDDLSKDVLNEEEEDIDLGEDSFDKDEEENMLVICFDIVSKGGDISPRHRRSGSNKKKKMTHGRQHS
ncbi:hypothetical protein CQW23_01586 [Capsicum baccatum]|uniref:Uncharacterized protein n=1 Tax=Capsicum baccatum TaxID=33114 RepID=A0A2G2XNZ7_CAPBA|nr:hypothetical protein CQW23_01586 [Capsicum baccatum]